MVLAKYDNNLKTVAEKQSAQFCLRTDRSINGPTNARDYNIVLGYSIWGIKTAKY